MFEVVLFNIGQMHPKVSKSVFRIKKFEWEGLQIHEIKNFHAQKRVGFCVEKRGKNKGAFHANEAHLSALHY